MRETEGENRRKRVECGPRRLPWTLYLRVPMMPQEKRVLDGRLIACASVDAQRVVQLHIERQARKVRASIPVE